MYAAFTLLLICLWSHDAIASTCDMVDWWKSFDDRGYSNCDSKTKYLNGLWRNTNGGKDDKINKIEKARCCPRTRPFYNQPTSCFVPDWEKVLDSTHKWATCPTGYFLNGLYRNKKDCKRLHCIEYAKCCKPANHPHYYGRCYDHDVGKSFDKKGLSKCNDGYYMTGIYRGSCDKLYCLEKFRCCKMVDKPPTLESLDDVKTRVMDVTMSNLASLAHYLGYGWCSSCRAQWVGEDFRRKEDSWEADKTGSCSGYKSGHRLKMHYKNFKFAIKDIHYGNPVIEDLKPKEFYSGVLRNDDPYPATVSLERTVLSTRTVTHTTSSSWEKSHEVGIEINYTPSDATGGVGGSIGYKFGYKNGETTTDSEGNRQTHSFTIRTSKQLPGNAQTNWKIMMAETKTTVSYTATVIATFSAELDGFLRWGGGYNGDSTNYHSSHRGSKKRPTVKYTFGSETKPFYEDLLQKSQQSQAPWQWNAMKQRHPHAQNVINSLTKEKFYEFKLTGKFVDVIGNDASIHYGS